jgi:tricorn protease
VFAYDLEARKEAMVLDDADVLMVTSDGHKALVAKIDQDDIGKSTFGIIELKPAQKIEKPLPVADLEVPVDPRAEWRQMFRDAFRFERTCSTTPACTASIGTRRAPSYLALVEQAVTRWDVNFVLGEFIAELNASHTYRSGGDLEEADQKSVGMLGVDWEKADNAWRIKRIVRGGPWDIDARSPLDEPGINAKQGDYVLAVNGVPMNVQADPWASFQGLGGKTIVLTLNSSPSRDGARDVVVTCLQSEVELRYRAWIEERRQVVDQATKGRVGYIYVQSTGVDAQNELMRQFMAQWDKDGLVIRRAVQQRRADSRSLRGAAEPAAARVLCGAGRRELAVAAGRPPRPEGDADQRLEWIRWRRVSYLLQGSGLGPLIGTRTWGG